MRNTEDAGDTERLVAIEVIFFKSTQLIEWRSKIRVDGVDDLRRCLVENHAGAIAIKGGNHFFVCRVGFEILQRHVGIWQ